nr:hypothetical protein [Agitococcus sp.]
LSRPDSVSDTRQAPFEGSFRVTALHPRPKAARFYGEFDKAFSDDQINYSVVTVTFLSLMSS